MTSVGTLFSWPPSMCSSPVVVDNGRPQTRGAGAGADPADRRSLGGGPPAEAAQVDGLCRRTAGGSPRWRAIRTCPREGAGRAGPMTPTPWARSGRSATTGSSTRARRRRASRPHVQPIAARPPTMAPMLDPPTWSIGMPSSASALITPMWAIPLAPPPPRTRPTDSPDRCRATRATSRSALSRLAAGGGGGGRRSLTRPRRPAPVRANPWASSSAAGERGGWPTSA